MSEVLESFERALAERVGPLFSDGTAFRDLFDLEAWPSMTRAARGPISQEQTIKYNALLGANNPTEFPGPGLVHHGMSKDDNQWHFWLRYYEMMTEAIDGGRS